jgi:hypothetical protein
MADPLCEHDWEDGRFETNIGSADLRCRKCGAHSWRGHFDYGHSVVIEGFISYGPEQKFKMSDEMRALLEKAKREGG